MTYDGIYRHFMFYKIYFFCVFIANLWELWKLHSCMFYVEDAIFLDWIILCCVEFKYEYGGQVEGYNSEKRWKYEIWRYKSENAGDMGKYRYLVLTSTR